MQFNIKDAKQREKLLCEIVYYMMTTGYKARRKCLYIPVDYVTEGGYGLGEIWDGLLEAYNKNQLSGEEIRFLLGIGMPFTDSPNKDLRLWMDRADEAESYFKEHGTLSMPNTTVFRDGASMFRWVHHQKDRQKKGQLSLYQQERLEGIGIQWIQPKEKVCWDRAYQYAEEFYNENGHLFVDRCYISSDGFELGKWIYKQREKYCQLSEERIEMLEDIGMFWEDIQNAEWDWFVGLLKECIRKTKKPFTISRNYRYKNYPLGEKVGSVIQWYGEGKLTSWQEKDLRDAGFKFNRVIK